MASSVKYPYAILTIIVALLVLLVAQYWQPSTRVRHVLNSARKKHLVDTTNREVFGPTAPSSVASIRHGNETTLSSNLTTEVIDGIKKLVLFVGYERSGHSIVGSLMDAHPHVVIAHEFFLFKKFAMLEQVPDGAWRDNLFQLLYHRSIDSKTRSGGSKGYTLKVEGLWEGAYDDHIEVIGDKSGGMATAMYKKDKQIFRKNFEKLKQKVCIPILFIHVLRNPFDMISTDTIYKENHTLLKYLKENPGKKTTSPLLYSRSKFTFTKFKAASQMINEIFGRENVLDIHNCDLVADPRGTLTKIFDFLEVNTSQLYFDACGDKVFKSVSRSRDLIEWPPDVRELVEKKISEYEMLSRYNFTSD